MMLLLVSLGCVAKEDGRYVIDVDLSAKYATGELVIWDRQAAPEGPKGKSKRGKPGWMKEIHRVNLVDGKGIIEGELSVENIRKVGFTIFNGVAPDGKRWGPMGGDFGFVLEPGLMKFNGKKYADFAIRKGKYNEILFGFLKSEEYVKASEEAADYYKRSREKGLSLEEKDALKEKGAAARARAREFKAKFLKKLALTDKDFITRKLAIELSSPRAGAWQATAVDQIRQQMPSLSEWAAKRIALLEKMNKKALRKEPSSFLGERIKNFESQDMEGKSLALNEVLPKHKYVLVELWASWCGPCREEIPYLKQAYKKFTDSGFEIFSFSLDKDVNDWKEAIEEEEMDWINVSDLKGFESSICKQFGVSGIPANFLVEGATGKVIGVNLRGMALERKLKELLGAG